MKQRMAQSDAVIDPATLPAVLTSEHMRKLLGGISRRTFTRMRPALAVDPVCGSGRPRWARDQVVGALNAGCLFRSAVRGRERRGRKAA